MIILWIYRDLFWINMAILWITMEILWITMEILWITRALFWINRTIMWIIWVIWCIGWPTSFLCWLLAYQNFNHRTFGARTTTLSVSSLLPNSKCNFYCLNPNSTNSSVQQNLRLDYILTPSSTHPPQSQLVYSKLDIGRTLMITS